VRAASALLRFGVSALPWGAQSEWARLRLHSSMASSHTNRLYMTVYPLDKPWLEEEVT
jgi:hypothetical protein